jgi:hypothetical protein
MVVLQEARRFLTARIPYVLMKLNPRLFTETVEKDLSLFFYNFIIDILFLKYLSMYKKFKV